MLPSRQCMKHIKTTSQRQDKSLKKSWCYSCLYVSTQNHCVHGIFRMISILTFIKNKSSFVPAQGACWQLLYNVHVLNPDAIPLFINKHNCASEVERNATQKRTDQTLISQITSRNVFPKIPLSTFSNPNIRRGFQMI